MATVQYILSALLVVFIYIVIIKVLMGVANFIGEQLGFGRLVLKLWQKVSRKQ